MSYTKIKQPSPIKRKSHERIKEIKQTVKSAVSERHTDISKMQKSWDLFIRFKETFSVQQCLEDDKMKIYKSICVIQTTLSLIAMRYN